MEENIITPNTWKDRNEVLNKGVEVQKDKMLYVIENKRTLKNLSELSRIKNKTLQEGQKLLFKVGEGWGDSCLDFAKDAKDKDIISNAFIRLRDVITTLVQTGQQHVLKEYINAMADCGIIMDIGSLIDSDAPEGDICNEIDNTFKGNSLYLRKVYEANEQLKSLAEDAEKMNLCPKSKFPILVGLASKKSDGVDIQEKISDEQFKMALYESGLEVLNEL